MSNGRLTYGETLPERVEHTWVCEARLRLLPAHAHAMSRLGALQQLRLRAIRNTVGQGTGYHDAVADDAGIAQQLVRHRQDTSGNFYTPAGVRLSRPAAM